MLKSPCFFYHKSKNSFVCCGFLNIHAWQNMYSGTLYRPPFFPSLFGKVLLHGIQESGHRWCSRNNPGFGTRQNWGGSCFATSSGQRTIQSSLTLLSFYRVGVIILYEAVVKVEENAFKAPHRTSPAYGGCSIKDEINTFWVTLDKLLNRFMPCFTCLWKKGITEVYLVYRLVRIKLYA